MNAASLPAYSVLMPLAPWEADDVLREALQSLAQQTFRPTQVVVSCDGEPSPELSRVLETAPLPICRVMGPGREGVGPVLARGLKVCDHDLVVRADADDMSVAERCVIQLTWMMQHPEVVAMSSWIEEFSDQDDARLLRRVPTDSLSILRQSRRRNPLNHPAVILRRQAVEVVGSYRHRPGFEDYDLWLRLLQYWGPACLANLPQALVRARVGQAHLTRRRGWAYALGEARFFLAAAQEGLLGWSDALLALALRLPLRLMPAGVLSQAMRAWTRTTVG